MAIPKHIRNKAADKYLLTNATLQQVAKEYDVSPSTVRYWARKKDPQLYRIAKGRTRQLLQAQDIVEVRPDIRLDELAKLVNVSRYCVQSWVDKGKLELQYYCEICGEPTTTKYCTVCREKGWDVYVRRYGLTYDQLRALPTACEVCGSDDRLHIDHDHETGKYRGVLCHGCNVALGMAKDNIEILEKLIKYLKTNK